MNIANLNLDDWAGIIFGGLGFLISVVALCRSIKADQRAETADTRTIENESRAEKLRIKQRLLEVLESTNSAELSLSAVKAQYSEFWWKGIDSGDSE